jgi:hypothetical protein
MYNDQHANKIDKYTALLIFWNNGWDTEQRLYDANKLLDGLYMPTNGYYLADDVVSLAHNL